MPNVHAKLHMVIDANAKHLASLGMVLALAPCQTHQVRGEGGAVANNEIVLLASIEKT